MYTNPVLGQRRIVSFYTSVLACVKLCWVKYNQFLALFWPNAELNEFLVYSECLTETFSWVYWSCEELLWNCHGLVWNCGCLLKMCCLLWLQLLNVKCVCVDKLNSSCCWFNFATSCLLPLLRKWRWVVMCKHNGVGVTYRLCVEMILAQVFVCGPVEIQCSSERPKTEHKIILISDVKWLSVVQNRLCVFQCLCEGARVRAGRSIPGIPRTPFSPSDKEKPGMTVDGITGETFIPALCICVICVKLWSGSLRVTGGFELRNTWRCMNPSCALWH